MDIFGVAVLGLVTALGGGTLRDMILDVGPVFWVYQPVYLAVAVGAAVATFLTVRFAEIPSGLLNIADAVGLAVFTVIGTEKALMLGLSPVIAVLMGVMTGVVGGMIRDILAGEIPLILRTEIYATASLSGGVVLTLITLTTHARETAVFLSIAVTLGLRLSALKWKLSLPVFISRNRGS
jgi:uncharacterized membrane protein YeiH